jgi:soluble lytic murein transglycosylase-like protein
MDVFDQIYSEQTASATTQPATIEQPQEVPEVKLPKKFVDRISNAGLNFDELDPLDVAQIKAESSGVHTIEGPQTRYGRAKGLMQLLDATGKEWHAKLGLEGKYDPFDAKQNLAIGKAYRDFLTDRYDGDVRLGLAAYNWGLGNLDKALKRTKSGTFEEVFTLMPRETRNYVVKIMKDVNGGVVSA